MIMIQTERHFEYPYLPKTMLPGRDSFMQRMRRRMDGRISIFEVKKIVGNLFVFDCDFSPGDIFKTGMMVVGAGEADVYYTAILAVDEKNIILSKPFKSQSEAFLEYELKMSGRSLEEKMGGKK